MSHLCSILQMWLERPVNFVFLHILVAAGKMSLGLVPTYAEQENAEDEDKSKPEEPAQVKWVQAIQNGASELCAANASHLVLDFFIVFFSPTSFWQRSAKPNKKLYSTFYEKKIITLFVVEELCFGVPSPSPGIQKLSCFFLQIWASHDKTKEQ